MPQLSLVICEGGPKAIKRFTRLMLVRMKWKGENFLGGENESDDDHDDNHVGNGDDGENGDGVDGEVSNGKEKSQKVRIQTHEYIYTCFGQEEDDDEYCSTSLVQKSHVLILILFFCINLLHR